MNEPVDGTAAAINRRRVFWLPSPGWAAVVVLAAVVLGCAFAVWWPYHCEQRVIAELNGSLRMSVGVTQEYAGPEPLRAYSDRPWMRWFLRIEGLNVQDQSWPAGVSRLPSLDLLRHCVHVNFSHSNVSDERFLTWVATCRNLESVSFMMSEVPGGALRGLDGKEGVREIRMEGCYGGPTSVLELPAIKSLKAVRINGGQYTGVDVSRAPNLLRLEAKSCHMTDDGVGLLAGAPRLEVVMLASHYGQLTDAAIAHLARVPRLRYLEVRFHPQITRVGLEQLAGMPGLTGVNVCGTKAEEELAELQRVLPQARSDYGP